MSGFNKVRKNTAFRVWLLVTAAFAAVLLVANLVLTQNLFIYNTVNLVFGGDRSVLVGGDPSQYKYYTADYENKAETLKAANALNERIVEEGIVMLKNDNSLPLKKGASVSVFGKNSVNLVYGGSGSGGASADGAVTLYDSLAAANFKVNPTLKSFYESSASGSGRGVSPAMGAKVAGLATGETPYAKYPETVRASYGEYNDAALIVISRIGGEGFDLPRTMKTKFTDDAKAVEGARSADDHYLQLDSNEATLIKEVGKRFDNVVVIINCSTAMELGFLDDETHYAYSPSVKGALWVGTPGKTGINALGKILNGEKSPSGRTVDTYARNFKDDPTWANFSNNNVTNGNRYTVNNKNKGYYFVDYEEGIYVGYRYYETRGVTEAEAGNPDWYDENVVYPMGYGLSYSNFDWTLVEEGTTQNGAVLEKDGEITVKVKVTNRGPYAGKDVVQLYYTAPYYGTKEKPGIEKSAVVLQDFAKTGELQPDESEIVTLRLKVSDMASYDYADANGNGVYGYEAEPGEYGIRISANAHKPVIELKYRIGGEGFTYDVDTKTKEKVENRFNDVSEHITTYLSRSDFEGTMPTTPTAAEREVTQEFIDSLEYVTDDEGKKWESFETPAQSKKTLSASKTDVWLYELIGKPYDDPLWKKLLDQLTVAQMSQLIGTGNYNTMAIAGIQKPKTIDPDGPVGFTNFIGDPSVYDTCFYASGCVLAASYNEQLAFEMGEMIGNEGIIGDERGGGTPYSGWYAPAVNIHRSPFSGRNWEYYSEDGLLSGKIAAGVIRGAQSKGVYTYVKHFALNDQETNRTDGGLLTWANEQSMRELYFKPFELAVKEGETKAMMSSFNRIGTTWAGGSYELLTEVLRDEWGFEGMVVTDYNLYAHMPADQMIRAGGDLNLCQDKRPSTDKTPTQVTALRKATHNILYTVVNSNAMNGYGEGVEYRIAMPVWVILLIVGDFVLLAGFAVWGFFTIRRALKKADARQNGDDAAGSVPQSEKKE